MHLRNFLWLRLIVASWASTVEMIRDYFLSKEVITMIGFTCAEYENDHQIVRTLNNVGISVSIEQLGPNINVSRSLRDSYWKIGVLMDLRCPFADEDVVKIFDEASALFMFKHLHQWLILDDSMYRTIPLINDSTFSIITDFVISLPRNDSYAFYDVYNPCKHCGGSLSITPLGVWTKDDGLNITLLENKFSKRRNYRQLKIKCAGITVARTSADRDLLKYLQDRDIVMSDNWAKFGYALIAHVAYMFNFTLDVIGYDHYDIKSRDGPLFASLRNRSIDLGYYPSITTQERLASADITLQVWPARTCFLFRTVPSSKLDMNIIFRPLARSVWYVTFLLCIIVMLALLVILKVDKTSNWNQTAFIVIAAISQQGLPFGGSQLSSRVAFLQTMFFGLLLYNCYSAAIVSSRLNNIPIERMNDSLISLVHSNLKLVAHNDSMFSILSRTKDPEVQYFRKHWDADPLPEKERFLSLYEGIKRIMSPEYAYHTDPSNAYALIERMFTNEMIFQLTEVHLYKPAIVGLWSIKHGQFREVTKIGLIRIYTAGLRKREVLRWTSRKPYYDDSSQIASGVAIIEVVPMILLLFGGMALSILICIIENIVFRMSRTKRGTMMPVLKRNKYHNSRTLIRTQRKQIKGKSYG